MQQVRWQEQTKVFVEVFFMVANKTQKIMIRVLSTAFLLLTCVAYTGRVSAQQSAQQTAPQRPDYPVSAQPAQADSDDGRPMQQDPRQGNSNYNGRVPQTLTLAPGTMITVRTTTWLSSDHNREGDGFSATIDQPIIADGWVVARRGQTLMG